MRHLPTFIIGLSTFLGACTSDSSATQPSTTQPSTTQPSTTRPSTSTSPSSETSAQPTSSIQPEAVSNRNDEVATLAAQIGASRMVVTDDAYAYLWSGGEVTAIASDESAWVWADSQFVYWSSSESNDDGSYKIRTTARTFEGDAACELEDHVTHVTERDDGSYVASVQREIDDEDYEAGVAYPRFAVAHGHLPHSVTRKETPMC